MDKKTVKCYNKAEKRGRTFLAVDIGASSGRHILGTVEDGRLTLEEIYRFSNSPLKVNDRLIWDTGRLFTEILHGLRRAGETGRVPESVAIDTWAVDYVLVDGSGARLGDAHSYRDTKRWSRAAERVHEKIPFAALYQRTGIQYQPFNTIYQLQADADEGLLGGAAQLFMLPEYFYYLLTGRAVREATNASSTGLINASTRGWDGEILHTLGFPERLFLPLSRPGARVGRFTEYVREKVGYDAEAVLCATHDTASAVIGSLAEEGEPYLSSGTWSLLGSVEREAHTEEASRRCNFSNEGHVGGAFRLQKNITGLWMIQRLREEAFPQCSFAQIADEARSAACDILIDANDPRFLAPRSMKREIEQAACKNLTAAECARCVFTSLAACYARTLRELESLTGRTADTLNIIGGGSKNTFLNELTARATGKRVVCGPVEATVAGNLAVQMVAAGAVSDLAAAKKMIRRSSENGAI